MSQLLACLYLENSFKQENNELNELSECMLYKMLAFLKTSQNCKTIFYKTISRTLACFTINVLKLFMICLLALL